MLRTVNVRVTTSPTRALPNDPNGSISGLAKAKTVAVTVTFFRSIGAEGKPLVPLPSVSKFSVTVPLRAPVTPVSMPSVAPAEADGAITPPGVLTTVAPSAVLVDTRRRPSEKPSSGAVLVMETSPLAVLPRRTLPNASGLGEIAASAGRNTPPSRATIWSSTLAKLFATVIDWPARLPAAPPMVVTTKVEEPPAPIAKLSPSIRLTPGAAAPFTAPRSVVSVPVLLIVTVTVALSPILSAPRSRVGVAVAPLESPAAERICVALLARICPDPETLARASKASPAPKAAFT